CRPNFACRPHRLVQPLCETIPALWRRSSQHTRPSSKPSPACSVRRDSLVRLLDAAIAWPLPDSSPPRSRCSKPTRGALPPTSNSALRLSGTRRSPALGPSSLRPRSCAASPIPSAPQDALAPLRAETSPQLWRYPWLRLVRAGMPGRPEPAIPRLRSRLSPEESAGLPASELALAPSALCVAALSLADPGVRRDQSHSLQ